MSLPADGEPLIRLSGVSKTYGHDGVPVPALRDVDLTVHRGEFTAVMGPSGSGKSTLLHIVGLLDGDYDGSYYLEGERMTGRSRGDLSLLRNRAIGFVFQQFHLLPQLSILENAALPALYSRVHSPEECKRRARERLERVDLGHRLAHRPNELSSGQRQRAAIARALVNEPALILADEPTGALDSKSMREILEIFAQLHAGGATIILITHDTEVAAVAQRTIHFRDGQTLDGVA